MYLGSRWILTTSQQQEDGGSSNMESTNSPYQWSPGRLNLIDPDIPSTEPTQTTSGTSWTQVECLGDLQGPKFRVGELAGEPVELKNGEIFEFHGRFFMWSSR